MVLGLFPVLIERIKDKFGLEAAVKDVLFAVVHAPVAQFISEKMIVKGADGLATPETRPFLLNASKRGIQCRDEAFYKPIVDQAYLQIKEYKDPVLIQKVVDLGVRVNKEMNQSEKGKLLVDLQKTIDEVGRSSPSLLVQVEKICEIAQQKSLIEIRHLDALKLNIRAFSGQQESVFSVGDLLARQSIPPAARAMVKSSSSHNQNVGNSRTISMLEGKIEEVAVLIKKGLSGANLAHKINSVCDRIEEYLDDLAQLPSHINSFL